MADPRRIGSQALAHAGNCRSCREFLAREREWEHQVEAALQVPVPRDLQERILLFTPAAPRISRRYALAAGLALGAAAGTALLWPRDDSIALAGIDFVIYEEAQAILDAPAADPHELRKVAAQVGVALPSQLGAMRYVGTCPFGGVTAHHVVLKTAFGKATLLLLPGRIDTARAVAAAHGLRAVVAPAAGGSVAIISNSSRSLDRIAAAMGTG